jgi:hypothetical protein
MVRRELAAEALLRNRLSARLVAYFALVAIASLVLPTATALAFCNPNRSHRDDTYQAGGLWTTTTPPNGVQADIDENYPYYTGWNQTGSLLSVMLSNSTQPVGANWAQLGWIKKVRGGITQILTFTETFDTWLNVNDWQYFPRSFDPVTNYKITYDETLHHFYYKVNGSQIDDYDTSNNWAPVQWEIFGETHDAADQMPGGYNIHAKFTSIRIRKVGGTWVVPPNIFMHDVESPIDYADSSNPAPDRIDVWDTACPS